MRGLARRSVSRLVLLVLLVAGLAPSLLAGGVAHADAAISISLVNPHVGLIHLTGTGFPTNRPLYVAINVFPLARPDLIDTYHPIVTFVNGSVDQDVFLGIVACGSYLKAYISDDQDNIAASDTIYGFCPPPNPTIAISSAAGGLATVIGQGFAIKEIITTTVTAPATGASAMVVAVSDNLGGLTVSVPLAGISCFTSLTAYVNGGAGSNATSAPFFYSCLVPPTPSPSPTFVPVAQPAGQAVTLPEHPAYLAVRNGPPAVPFQGIETLRMATGMPGVQLNVHLWLQGQDSGTLAVQTDTQGNARLDYRVQTRLGARQRKAMNFTVSYTTGVKRLRQTGSFIVVGT